MRKLNQQFYPTIWYLSITNQFIGRCMYYNGLGGERFAIYRALLTIVPRLCIVFTSEWFFAFRCDTWKEFFLTMKKHHHKCAENDYLCNIGYDGFDKSSTAVTAATFRARLQLLQLQPNVWPILLGQKMSSKQKQQPQQRQTQRNGQKTQQHMHGPGCSSWAAVEDDFEWDSVEADPSSEVGWTVLAFDPFCCCVLRGTLALFDFPLFWSSFGFPSDVNDFL